MTDRPMIFSAPMVRALIEGRKTQTRRLIGEPSYWHEGKPMFGLKWKVGDRLWAREAWAKVGDNADDIHACPDLRVHVYYRADSVKPETLKWRSPIHMPRRASRATLTITDVRVQRVQEISEEDAKEEGIYRINDIGGDAHGCWTWGGAPDFLGCWSAVSAYSKLWNSLHGSEAWTSNPWVAALTFAVDLRNIDAGVKAAA